MLFLCLTFFHAHPNVRDEVKGPSPLCVSPLFWSPLRKSHNHFSVCFCVCSAKKSRLRMFAVRFLRFCLFFICFLPQGQMLCVHDWRDALFLLPPPYETSKCSWMGGSLDDFQILALFLFSLSSPFYSFSFVAPLLILLYCSLITHTTNEKSFQLRLSAFYSTMTHRQCVFFLD